MKTPEEIFDEAIKSKGLDTVSVRDADLYEAGLDAIKQALSIADVVGRSEQLKAMFDAHEKETGHFTMCKEEIERYIESL
jgi:hypothetical protein